MNLRGRFAVVLIAFSLLLTLAGGVLSYRVTSRALDEELDEKLAWVAGAAAEVGFDGHTLLNLRPGDEAFLLWQSNHNRLLRLRRYVEEAYIFRRGGEGGEALVTSRPASEIPVGTFLRFLAAYPNELERAWEEGEATTRLFRGEGGESFKYGFKRLGESDAMLAVLMRADFLEPLARLQRTLIVGAFLGALAAGILAYLLAAGIVQPLERLSRAALRIQRGRWETPVMEERGDEVGRLSRAMERMRQGILLRDEQLRLMLAQVAHEIRNPLGGLELFATAALETDSPEERRRLLRRVRAEVEALNAIINDFLGFARPLDPDIRLHDLREPVREAAELMQLEMQGNGRKLHVELPEVPLMGRADPDHAKRAVLNLLKNAASASGHVWLRAWWWNGEVVVSVKDDGPGVPEALKDRIFEPFVTDKEQGAGLGLAIVKRVLESNGARIALMNSEAPREGAPAGPSVGKGAEFRVYFPGSEDLPGDDRDGA
jgi:signal transduction histidine kinase